jgi:hypothetical protein
MTDSGNMLPPPPDPVPVKKTVVDRVTGATVRVTTAVGIGAALLVAIAGLLTQVPVVAAAAKSAYCSVIACAVPAAPSAAAPVTPPPAAPSAAAAEDIAKATESIRAELDASKKQVSLMQAQLEAAIKDRDLARQIAAKLPAQPAPSGRPPPPKIMIDVPVLQLMDAYKDRTVVQGDATVAPYIGKWLTYHGIVSNVSRSYDNRAEVLSKLSEEGSLFHIIKMTFEEGDSQTVFTYSIGHNISAQCRVRGIDSSQIMLEMCNLIEANK